MEIATVKQSNESLIKDKETMTTTIQQKSMVIASLQENNTIKTTATNTTPPQTEMEPLRRKRYTESPQVQIINPQNDAEQTYQNGILMNNHDSIRRRNKIHEYHHHKHNDIQHKHKYQHQYE